MPNKIQGYNDPNHPGNGLKYHTRKLCIEDGCFRVAGTMWGPYWCFKHNVERIDRIDKALEAMIDEFSRRKEELCKLNALS